jgi:C4-type Zn-finger protein
MHIAPIEMHASELPRCIVCKNDMKLTAVQLQPLHAYELKVHTFTCDNCGLTQTVTLLPRRKSAA